MIADARTDIISEVMKTVSTNGTGDRNKVEKIVNEKLRPVQDAVEDVKSESARNFYLSRSPKATIVLTYEVLKTLYNERKPLTANEIADKNRAPRSLMQGVLEVLAEMKIVNAVRGEDGKTRFVVNESAER